MRRDRYGAYHGRSRAGMVLKILIGVLLVLLAAALAALLFLEPYIIYSADGVRLELPFFQKEEPDAPASQPPLVVETAQPTPTLTPEPAEEFRGVLLARTALYDGTAEAQTAGAGATAAIFDMKGDDGSLGYISQLELAQASQVSAADPAINAAIQLLNGGELRTVARVSCFRDNTVPRENGAMSIRKSGGNWRDGEDIRWLSPASPEARAYVTGVCRELAELGFDELLLDNCGFPTQGRLDQIAVGGSYDPESLDASLELFFRELEEALAGYPELRISVVSTRPVLEGEEDGSGQTTALLETYADRVLVRQAEEAEEPLPDRLGQIPVVEITAEAGSGTGSWVLLTQSA